jgi:hypothetical protein
MTLILGCRIALAQVDSGTTGSVNTDGLRITQVNGDTLISDSLVLNLSCHSLTRDNVFSNLQPHAFTSSRHIPLQNWPQNFLGQCWSLSLAQRELFYLVRFGGDEGNSQQQAVTKKYIMDLAKGNADYRIASISTEDLDTRNTSNDPVADPLFTSAGENSELTNGIAAREIKRFISPFNAPLAMGNRDRHRGDNKATMKGIVRSLAQGRMPLLVIRPQINEQHVVLVKSATGNMDTGYTMSVYDSNFPDGDNELTYKDKEFYASEIIERFAADSTSPVGVFMEDEGDMDKIQDANFAYYAKLCGKQSNDDSDSSENSK